MRYGRDHIERRAVGCLLLDCPSATFGGVMPDPTLFRDGRYLTIVETVCARLARHQKVATDLVGIELNERGLLTGIGGWSFLSDLEDDCIPPMFPDLQAALHGLADAEKTAQIAAELGEALKSGSDPATAISESMAAIQAHSKTSALLTETKPLKEVLLRAIDRYEKLVDGNQEGIPTGFFPIDNVGGLQPGEMVLIAGQTGIGKSTLALNMLHAAILAGVNVAVFSLEMSDQAWLDRLISLDLKIDRRAFRSKGFFTQGVLQKIAANTTRLSALPVWLCDDPMISTSQMRSVLTRLAAVANVRLFVVDYVQLVAPSGGEQSREQQVAGIGRAIHAICRELGLVGLALSQLNDDGKVRESRALMQAADVAFFIEEKTNGDDTSLWITTAKGREVAVPDFPVDFDVLTCRITQRSQVDHPRRPHND